MKKYIKALSDPKYDYYRLTKDFGVLKAGAIFYHDPDDDVYGSIAQGCLKLCWTPDGNCYGSPMIGGDTVILNYAFANTDWFEKVERNLDNLGEQLKVGKYKFDVDEKGCWKLSRYGDEVEH